MKAKTAQRARAWEEDVVIPTYRAKPSNRLSMISPGTRRFARSNQASALSQARLHFLPLLRLRRQPLSQEAEVAHHHDVSPAMSGVLRKHLGQVKLTCR